MSYNSRMKRKTEKYTLIIRNKSNIKSRQWWKKKLNFFIKILPGYISKNKLKLVQKSTFTLLITSNPEIKKLNLKFRGKNKETDVLAFPYKARTFKTTKYLGDIVISLYEAIKNAKQNNLSLEVELLMLLIHGYLHLLGYNHKNKKEAKSMFSLQNGLLIELIYF